MEQEQNKGIKMPRDLRVGISMMLTLLESQEEDDFMIKVIINTIKKEAKDFENHQDLTKLVAIKSIMTSMYDSFADALVLLKDTKCFYGVAEIRLGDECDSN